MIETVTALRQLWTPDDADTPEQIAAFIDEARPGLGLCWSAYGATDVTWFAAITRAVKRGVVVPFSIFDKTQSGGKTQKALIAQLRVDCPTAKWVIGTSRRHQIAHAKFVVANFPLDGNWPEMGVYPSVQAALNDGKPAVLWGSYNFTTKAMQQVNTVTIAPGVLMAQAFVADCQSNAAWIEANEPQVA